MVKRGVEESEEERKKACVAGTVGSGAAAHGDGEEQRSRWPRPPLPPVDPRTQSLAFQQLDCDYVTGKPVTGMPGAQTGAVPVVRMFGVTGEGNSVLCHVHGFTPYFYVPAPSGFAEEHCATFRRVLQDALKARVHDAKLQVPEYVLAVEMVLKQSVFGFYGNVKSTFLQVFVALPRHVPAARSILENGLNVPPFGLREYQTFESNNPYALRFMIDTGLRGAAWAELPAGKYTVRPVSSHDSSSQIEVDVAFDAVVAHDPEGAWSRLAPLRTLSFDIECAARKGCFPEPDKDPVIQIANLVSVHGHPEPIVKNVFVLGSCTPIVGAHVLTFGTEKELLAAWRKFFSEVDPDVVIGYNTANFDIPYLIDRAATLGVHDFPFLGRLPSSKSIVKNTTFSSKAYGTRESKSTEMEGRVQLDIMQVLQRDHKLSAYSLNAVSAHFLGEQKEDVHHSIIADLHNGSPEDRRRLAVYCVKDAYLPLRLMDKLMILYNYVEMARVTGVPLSYLLSRGQQIKVLSQLYRAANAEDLVIPTFRSSGSNVKYEGASVLEPKRGYYEVPVATLDFASLYPSIIRAHNLCYTTLLNPADTGKLNADQYVTTPNGNHFVKPSVRKGLLPSILESLLLARKRAKDDLKKETDPLRRSVLDAKQLSLKVSANSVYGFTGATQGSLPCLEISASVTAYGREMIAQTAALVEEKYTVANGHAHDAVVLYGDTDSVMVKFGCATVGEAMEMGKEAAAMVTATFPPPIKLEFEKVFYPWLLINKKRYAGMYWTNPDTPDRLDAKGLEIVRRDNSQLVRTVLTTCLNKVLRERDLDGATEYAKGVIRDLLNNRVDLSMLVITKSLSKSADEYDGKQAHAELAERMRKRDPATAPNIGDRVAYVITMGAKGAKAWEKAEDPIYVLENSIPIDTNYYIQQQLAQPLLRLFEPILGEAGAKSLLTGDHTRNIRIVTPTSQSGGIMRFAVKTVSCLGCRAAIPADAPSQTLCKHCMASEPEIYVRHLQRVSRLEEDFSRAWTQCQRCQGSFHQEVLCTSRDCPIYYRRKKVQKDLGEAQAALERFAINDDDW